MMKQFALIIHLLFSTSCLWSQSTMGALIGINWASWNTNQSSSEIDRFGRVVSPTIGLFFESRNNDKTAIRNEIALVSKGLRLHLSERQAGVLVLATSDIVLKYAEYRGFYKYVLRANVVDVGILAGASVSYAMSGEIVAEAQAVGPNTTATSNRFDIDFDELGLKRLDIGLHFGVDGSYPFAERLQAFGSLRFEIGLLNIEQADGVQSFNRGTQFIVGVGYLIDAP